jgi:acetyl esterase/lipase
MASSEADYLRALYQDWSDRMGANPDMNISDLRAMFGEWESVTLEPEDVSYKSGHVGGVDGVWAYPVDGDRNKVLLYTHGGGFVVGSSSTHRKIAGHIAKALGVTAFVMDYRLAPEHPFPAQVDDAVAVFNGLIASGIAANDIATIGDSAGGNLAVATVLRLRELDSETPGCVIAFSPWVDMQLTGGSLDSKAATDALVQRPILEGMRGMFLGETTAVDHPIASPLISDFKGYPPLYINAGSDETLLDDALRLHEKARSAGVNSTISVVEDMQHVFPFLAGRAPEADEEIERIAEWYKAL